MPDREKVIKAIECCVLNNTRCFDDNDKLCPYFSTKVCMCEIELLKDALELLKEQEHKDRMFHALEDDWKRLKELPKEHEAVEPKTEQSARGYWYTCGACGWWLFEVRDTVHFDDRKRIRFCASCGKMVKWE